MQIDNENRFREAIRRPFNLFAGAGFSVLAGSSQGPLPIGNVLADELRDHFSVDSTSSLSLAQLTTVLSRSAHEDLDRFLRTRFSVQTFDVRYRTLLDLNLGSIFSTNIDNLFSRIYENSREHYLNDVYAHGAAINDRTAVELIQLHGSVTDLARPLTFSTLDIAAAKSHDPDQWNLFRQRLRDRPTIFCGYAMADSGTLEAVRSQEVGQSTDGDAWIQVRPGVDANASSEYFRALGFQIILADTEELLDWLADFAAETEALTSPASPSLGNVPSPGQTVARPIEEYFLGSPPTWSDIYSRGVAQTSFLRRAEDVVAAHRHLLITGIPGCGKTTLAMQIAAFTKFDGPKLIFDGLTEGRANLLARQIGRGKALLILDNVASDFTSFEILSALPNASVIGADREYNLGSVSSRVHDAGAEILPISDLHAFDLQYLWNAIPPRIRKQHREDPTVARGRTASTFEFVMANVSSTPIGDRLIESIHEMADEGSLEADLLLAASYMQYCRSTLSMDVVIAYMRGLLNDYSDLYQMIDNLGSLLADVKNSEQDHFVARSMLVSELVLRGVRPSILREFLTRFHSEVSPLRVPHYDTFRRRGFHWRIFSRAFNSVPQGCELYDEIILRDDSPEILQQKALFLADKRQYEDAFFELDRARARRRKVSWSIENSFYNVLFKANIDRAHTDSASKEQCASALDGLMKCFRRDSRKGLHALVFSECAKTYAQIDDTGGRAYLESAAEMLTSVIETEPWLYRPPILLTQVNRSLRGLPTPASTDSVEFDEES